MNISIFAAIGSKNLGDELILKNEIQFFQRKYGEKTKFYIYTYDKKKPFIVGKNIKYIEYFPCDIKNKKKIFRNIQNLFSFFRYTWKSDLIVIGGGGIFFDNEVTGVSNPLKQWKFRTDIFRLLRKKVKFHAIGINIKNKTQFPIISQIFSGKNVKISVRDKYSHDLLSKLGYDSKIVADPVFSDDGSAQKSFKTSYCLDNIHPRKFHIDDLSGYNFKDKLVGISFRSGYFWDDKKIMTEIIEYVLKQKGKIIFIPNSFHPTQKESNDYEFMKSFAEHYGIPICKNMKQAYRVYKEKKIDICFAMRLHGIILSQVYKIPYVAFSYAKKTEEILKIIKKSAKK